MHILKRIGQFLRAWFLAAILTVILAVIFQTQRQVGMLDNVEANITFGERLSMTLYNLQHMSGLYGIFILLGLMVAFLAGLFVYRLAKFGRPIVFMVAGATAMIVMLLWMKEAFFGVHLIGGAREAFGLSLQALAGALGGLVFAKLFAPGPHRDQA